MAGNGGDCSLFPHRPIISLREEHVVEAKRSVIVVGAGVFGITGAMELLNRGYDVALFDPGPLPRPEASSSDISKCIRMDYGDDALMTELAASTFPVWEMWNRTWAEELYHEDGFLFLTHGPMEPGTFEHDSFRLLEERGVPVERMNPQLISERYPAFAPGVYRDGYFNPQAGWAASGRVLARLTEEARVQGVRIHEGQAFQQLRQEGSRVTGIVTTYGKVHSADHVIMATGAWTPTLLPHLQPLLQAVAQPVLHFQVPNLEDFRPPRLTVWGSDLSRTGWYGFPALPDGTLKVSHHGPGIPIHPDDSREVPAEWEERFRTFLRQALPALADAPVVGGKLCFYCDSFDGNFLIDHDPEHPGLLVAAGGSGHGFKFAPVLGSLIADALERVENRFGKRFRWRPAGPRTHEKARFTSS